jgi:hypothetical protein
LPPTDPRFLNATIEEIETDYWAHFFFEHPNAANEVIADDPDFDIDEIKGKIESGDWETL